MLDKNGIAARLFLADTRAKEQMDRLKAMDSPSLTDYETCIHRYVLAKFLLDDEPNVSTQDLNELASLSVRKAHRLKPAGNERDMLDISGRCGSVSSAAAKKVLLLVALQKEMEIDLTSVDTAYIETTGHLAQTVMQLRNEKKVDERPGSAENS